MKSIFLSYSHADQHFVRRLAADLGRHNVPVWVDEGEMMVGDSLLRKIAEGIDEVDFVGAVISASSVESPWVQKELEMAMTQEIKGRRVKVLPLRLDDCVVPSYLDGKIYADFRDHRHYDAALSEILRPLGAEGTTPARVPRPQGGLELAVEHRLEAKSQDEHRYVLEPYVRNASGQRSPAFHIDVSFPKAFLGSAHYGGEVKVRETETHKVIRFESPAQNPIYPEDRRRMCSLNYRVDTDLHRKGGLDALVTVTLYAPGQEPRSLEMTLREIQQF